MKIWPVVNELNDMRLQRLAEAKATQQEVEDAIVAYITMIDTAKKDADTRENENLQTFKRQIEQLAFEVKSTGDSVSTSMIAESSSVVSCMSTAFKTFTTPSSASNSDVR